MKRRHLDNIYFRVMRGGRAINICWTDLDLGDIVEFMDKHNNEAWLIGMIQCMNELAYWMGDLLLLVRVQPVAIPKGKRVSLI